MAETYQRHPELVLEKVGRAEDDDYIVYHPQNEEIHVVNFSAGMVLESLAERKTVEEVVLWLQQWFTGESETLYADVQSIIEDFVLHEWVITC